ncbi:MAG: cell division protein ZipA [Pseudomonadota bacterium]
MDIKDFILIAGGILIAMVVGHGFWIGYRARREPLRLDIVPDLIPGDIDEMERLRGELPNGGARVISPHRDPAGQPVERRSQTPADEYQAHLDFAAESGEAAPPVLMDPVAAGEPTAPQESPANRRPHVAKGERHAVAASARPASPSAEPVVEEQDMPSAANEPELQDEPSAPAAQSDGQSSRARVREVQIRSEVRNAGGREVAREQVDSKPSFGSRFSRSLKPAPEPQPEEKEPVAGELLILHVLAPHGQRFGGESLVHALRAQGLRYGDMSIFHRVDNMTKAKLYSVANLVEPGTFDLADLEQLRSPGMSFFMRLPGPDDALGAFEDMLAAARGAADMLGGEVRDEQHSIMTGQTAEHMRQRIADFTRRRLSKRA